MSVTPETALLVALIALGGVLVNALITLVNARKRATLDERLLLLKAQLDGEVTRIQQAHAERLASLEHIQAQEAVDRARVQKVDASRLRALLQDLDPVKTIAFFREHDFGGAFRTEDIRPLYRFVERAPDPDQSFLDPSLEELRVELLNSGKALASTLAMKTSPTSAELSSVLPDAHKGVPRPDWVNANARKLNELATAFVEKFDQLVRTARAQNEGADG
jgi:hypothetical protein